MYKQEYLKYKKKYIESKKLHGGNKEPDCMIYEKHDHETIIKCNDAKCGAYIYYNTLPVNFRKFEDENTVKPAFLINDILTYDSNNICKNNKIKALTILNSIKEKRDTDNKTIPIYLEDNSYILKHENKSYYWSLIMLMKNYNNNKSNKKFDKMYSIYNVFYKDFGYKMIYENTETLTVVLKILYLIVHAYYKRFLNNYNNLFALSNERQMDDEQRENLCKLYDHFDNYVSSSFLKFYNNNEYCDYFLKQSLHETAIKNLDELIIIKKNDSMVLSYNEILNELRFNIYYSS